VISRKYGSYSEFKDSGSGWLGKIPTHWSANKLKFVANAFASNVDKKTKDGEIPVRLCNYTDVYYNDVIRPGMPFMVATATQEQITKFTLRAGDTIITKDSEDPNDIAIPTFVAQDMPGVICGYHLSIIRPAPTMSPEFLNKTFQCAFARAYFATRSNGLTRYGLGGQALGSVVIPVPPLDEQTQIAKFLDYETAKIDALIAKQQQLIALLQEKRQAVISHAVTKGLNPAAPLRDSGVEWLGQVPAHWEVRKLKHISDKLQGRLVVQPHLYVADEGVPIVFGYNIKNGKIDETDVSKISFSADMRHPHAKAKAGDVYTVRLGDPGATAVVPKSLDGCHFASIMWIHQHPRFVSEWLSHCMNSDILQRQINSVNYGAAQTQFNISDAVNFVLPFPPLAEQHAIAEFLDRRLAANAHQVERAEEMKALLQERRTALIAAAVTGKIDVRGWQPPPAAAAGGFDEPHGAKAAVLSNDAG
jgi:type I restriction enzyme S subunit